MASNFNLTDVPFLVQTQTLENHFPKSCAQAEKPL